MRTSKRHPYPYYDLIRNKGELRTLASSEGSSITFSKVKFEVLKGVERWISESDVSIGTGDTDLDRRRLNLLQQITFLRELEKENILAGLITKGMTREFVTLALGQINLVKTELMENSVVQVYECENGTLRFKDNLLVEWEILR